MHSHRIRATTLGDLLLLGADRAPTQELLVFPDKRSTYGALVEAAYARARSLAGLGVGPGDHVGILMANCQEFIELLFGCAFLGAVAVPVNARNKAAELGYVVENADLKVLVTSDLISEYADFGALLTDALPGLAEAGTGPLALPGAPRLRAVVMLGEQRCPGMLTEDAFTDAGAAVSQAQVDALRVRVQLSDPAIMMYTSGTTSNPKGCPLSHGLLTRNGINMNRERYFLSASDRFWAPLPMFHMAAILPLLACLDAGATMLSMLHVEPGAALDMLEHERVTVAFPSFPTVTNDLISHPTFRSRDLSALRRINNVAPVEMLRQFQAAFPQAVQTGAYGMTEAGGVVSFNHPDETLETRLHTCGRPFPGIDIKIVDLDNGEELPPGAIGECLLRGYAVFDGYYKAPEKNAESFTDGWFRTGDLCAVDENGAVTFHGRAKDMLKVGGENVAALEIESVLASHPAVAMAQVIGVPDARLLEVACAFVELAEGADASETDLIMFCRDQLASFKVPRYVRFVREWPMSATKIQKYRLREQFMA